ncbi:MAG: RlmE family RNA methyltransferase [Proteobacteria bacterium]|nr:RlmE family RNA methyltransferase [Pseudomonadota bacterium]
MGTKRSAKSHAWNQRQNKDIYVREARARSLRSRSVFKLEQIDQKERLFRPGFNVLDLGAAPGGWSQYAASKVRDSGQVIALDRLEIDPIPGVKVILGDFLDSPVVAELNDILSKITLNLVISDMAPNLTGIKDVDQPAMGNLVTMSATFASQHLSEQGVFVAKFFEGAEAQNVKKTVARLFSEVRVRKPDASRPKSAENYIVARRPIKVGI